MKTVFVTLPIGLSVRNILFTGVLDKLISLGDVRVVVFTAVPDLVEHYPYAGDCLVFESLPPLRVNLNRILNRMLNIRFFSIHDDQNLTSHKQKRRAWRITNPGQYLCETILSQPFPRSKTLFQALSAFHCWRSSISESVRSLFANYQPSAVFATNPSGMNEFEFLRYASVRNIKTIGMIHSWDVLTTEGRIVSPLDYHFVWNQVMKTELVKLHGVSEGKIRVTGIPQFDIYAEPETQPQRDDFLRQQGCDPEKRVILFATSPWRLTPDEPEIVARLRDALDRECPNGVQILVRVHQQDDFRRYASIRHPNIVFQVPGVSISALDDKRLMDRLGLSLLRDTLRYSDVVVNTASTITIDAAALDRPVVNMAFDLHERSYYRSVRRYFDTVHFRRVAESGASGLAHNLDELIMLVLCYLRNPQLKRVQRASLTETMCFKTDGKSAERIASFLKEILDGRASFIQ